MDESNLRDNNVIRLIELLLKEARDTKPNDRSDKDRKYAILITKIEDILAWALYMEAQHGGS